MLGPWSRQRSCYCWAHVSLPQGWKCIVARDLSLSRCQKAFLAGDLRKCPANCFSFRSTLYGAVLAEGAGRLHRSTGAPCIPHGGLGGALPASLPPLAAAPASVCCRLPTGLQRLAGLSIHQRWAAMSQTPPSLEVR